MAQYLRRALHELTLFQVNHEAGVSKPCNGFERILQYLLLGVAVDGDVVKVNHHWQLTSRLLSAEHVLHNELKVRRGLSEPHWHAEPTKFSSVSDKGGIVGRCGFEDDVVKSSF